jgi:hypothetical protein
MNGWKDYVSLCLWEYLDNGHTYTHTYLDRQRLRHVGHSCGMSRCGGVKTYHTTILQGTDGTRLEFGMSGSRVDVHCSFEGNLVVSQGNGACVP